MNRMCITTFFRVNEFKNLKKKTLYQYELKDISFFIYNVTVTYFYLGDGFQQVPSYLVCGSQMDL